MARSTFASLFGWQKAPALSPSARPARLRLQALEDRCVPSTLTVVNTDDHGAGSLRAAVAAAAPGDTIKFKPSLAGKTITLTSGQILLDKSLDVEGLGANRLTISGNHAGRVFDVRGAAVTLAGLTIADGSVTASETGPLDLGGGGILNEADASLTLRGVTLADNTATASSSSVDVFGGGLLNEGAAVVCDSTFRGNVATGGGGGSFFAGSVGGGIDNFGGATLTVTGCTFTGNQALGVFGIGGAIENNAGLDPFNNPIPSKAIITDCAFTGNLAGGFGNGGALDNEGHGASMTVSGCTLTDNRSVGDAVTGGGGLGGAIMNYSSSTLTVTDCAFRANQALGAAPGAFTEGLGGAIQNGPGPEEGLTTADVDHSSFTGNVAGGVAGVSGVSGFGGALNNAGPGAVMTVNGCALVGNLAIGGGGGGIDNASGATLTVSGSAFVGNQALGCLVQDLSDFGGGVSVAGGGAINNGAAFLPTGTVTADVSDCVFIGNVVTGAAGVDGNGGALCNQGVNATMTVNSSTLLGNVAIGGAGVSGADGGNGVGGGIFDDGMLILQDCTLEYNLAQGGKGGNGGDGGDDLGGGLAIQPGASATVSDSTITHNVASGGARGAGGSDGQGVGGGVYDLGAYSAIATILKKNHATTSNDDFYQ